MYRGYKHYTCPFCDMVMPNDRKNRSRHFCNSHDIERFKETQTKKEKK